jgi:arabinose-5-phosphate isomerase
LNTKERILFIAKKAISIESEAILALHESIDDDFVAVVNWLTSFRGKVVITGIGKSAIVGQKIVATFNSTGTPAIFMHAADAIHGDLGIIQKEDIVICISKSGETPEIKILVPLLKNIGNKLIALVSNRNSTLAKQADITLYIPIEKEADPNNLAPTASTTAQMVMGDALAIAVLDAKGFSSDDFAKFHPGGMLGKQLYMKVGDLSSLHKQPFVHSNDDIKKVIIEISTHRLGAVAVTDTANDVLGMITDGDLRRMLNTSENFMQKTAADIMNAHPKTINIDKLAIHALEMMKKHAINQLIVLENEKYAGMVHVQDLIKEGII